MEMNDDFRYMNDDLWPSEQGWWTMSLPMYEFLITFVPFSALGADEFNELHFPLDVKFRIFMRIWKCSQIFASNVCPEIWRKRNHPDAWGTKYVHLNLIASSTARNHHS